MANQDISLSNYDPDAARIQRQQRLAQMLQEQSQQDIPIQSYNGIQAPISPLSLIAKALQAYQGKKLADQADTQYGDLQTKRRKDFADMLSKQYQVPGSSGMVTNQPNTQTDVSGIQAPTISGVTEDRPTTPQEQMANSLSMMGSNNPMAAQVAPQFYEDAQKKQQAAQLLSGLDLSKVPPAIAPVIRSQIQAGDIPGATKTYEAAMAPKVVGNSLIAPDPSSPTGYKPLFEGGDSSIKEYQFAKQQGFTGTLADWQKAKAQNTHITVDAGAHGWQVVNDASGQPYRYNPNTGQSTKLDGSPLQGGPSGYAKVATPNMRNPVAIYMDSWSKEHPGASAADKLTAMNAFAGQQATARTLGNIEAKVGSASNGLDVMADQANEAYNKLGRGNFVPFNKLQQMAATNAFSSPEQADAYAADTGVINLWGKAINPSGVLTVEAQKRGEQMLSQAQSPEAHAAVLARMKAESRASRGGVTTSQASIGAGAPPAAKTVVRTGRDAQGNKVVQYSDGTIAHAP